MINQNTQIRKLSTSFLFFVLSLQEVENALRAKNPKQKDVIKKHLHLSAVEHFMNECLGIAWKMVIQRPRMLFHFPYPCDEEKQTKWQKQPEIELMFESNPKAKDAAIQYYKQPCLYLGDQLMAKGVVYVGP